MGGFGWIGGLLRGLGSLLRNSGPAAPWLILGAILFFVGLVLVLLGFDLGEVDSWIDAQGGWLHAVFSLLFQAVCALVFLLCLFSIGGAIFDRKNPERPGIGCALLAILVAYFAWFGMLGD